MTKRLWPVFFVSLCILLPGCQQEEAKPELTVQQPAPAAIAQRKPKKEKPAPPAPPPAAADLKTFIPPSLSAVMGVKPGELGEVSGKTGIDFAGEIRQATLVLAVAGFVLDDVDELWTGSNPATQDGILCAKMVKQYDRSKLREALHIGDGLGKIGGIDLHSLPSMDGTQNAVAFVDDKVLMIGRRQTVEAALKKPPQGPLRSALAVTGIENPAYWVMGDADHYLALLGLHGFSAFASNSEANVPPAGFALAIPAKSLPMNTVSATQAAAGPAAVPPNGPINFGGAKKSRRQREREEDDAEEAARNAAPQMPTRTPVTSTSGTITVVLGFEFENSQQAAQMERRTISVLETMPEKLKTAASYNIAWTDSAQGAGPTASNSISGKFRKDSRDLLHDISRELRPLEATGLELSPIVPQVRPFESDNRKQRIEEQRRKAQKGGNNNQPGTAPGSIGQGNPERKAGIGIRPPVNPPNASPGIQLQSTSISFEFAVTRDENHLRVQVEMNLPNAMVSVAAAVQQAVGATLTGGGMTPGTLTMVAAAAKAWSGQRGSIHRGVKTVPDMPVLSGYSWMTELLPYLGRAELYGQIDFNTSWTTNPENHRIAGVVIPEFLDPATVTAKWQGYPYNGLALTNFVGMSGVEDGPNVVAATLKRSDPRAGFFGYDDVAKPREITDGASKTIMLIGAGRFAGPWIQGGGATVRGAREPYFDEISGFGSPGMKTPGAVVLFADGSSREISADIAPEVFRAMCTIHGAEKVDIPQGQPPQGVVPPQAASPTAANGIQNVINFFKSGSK